MKFELNEAEKKKADEFIDMCHLIEGYRSVSVDDKRSLSFQYLFSKSSGTSQSSAIECLELEIGISLTDYSNW